MRGENFDLKANERFLQNVAFLPESSLLNWHHFLSEPEQETDEEKFIKAIKTIFEDSAWEFVDIKCAFNYEKLETTGVLIMREKRTEKTYKVPLGAEVFEYEENAWYLGNVPNKIARAANCFAGELKAIRHISEASYNCLLK